MYPSFWLGLGLYLMTITQTVAQVVIALGITVIAFRGLKTR